MQVTVTHATYFVTWLGHEVGLKHYTIQISFRGTLNTESPRIPGPLVQQYINTLRLQ